MDRWGPNPQFFCTQQDTSLFCEIIDGTNRMVENSQFQRVSKNMPNFMKNSHSILPNSCSARCLLSVK